MSKQLAKKAVTDEMQLKSDLKALADEIKKALPLGTVSADRFARCLITEFKRNPKLFECTRFSVLSCLMQAAQLGLEIGGPLGQIYMVPYMNRGVFEAQFQIGYKGYIALIGRSCKAVIYAHVVYEKDQFRINLGTNQHIDHTPFLNGDRGEPRGVYAIINYDDRPHDSEYMSWSEIMAHAAKYSKQTGDRSPWRTATEEMAKKTVIRRLCKRCPISVEVQHLASVDEYAEEGVPIAPVPIPDHVLEAAGIEIPEEKSAVEHLKDRFADARGETDKLFEDNSEKLPD